MAYLLDRVVVGYDKIEPVIMANVALGKNFILIGRHGTCKTTLARTLAQGYGGPSVVYDATKDDIVSICGIPKTKALEEGRFEFAIGERTIWDKQLIVIDELGRATKENQNILLEILQERTCFGKKLEYKIVIATMNPETYAASLRLDEALLDRFYAVLPVPDFAKGIKRDVVLRILEMNFQGRQQEDGKEFSAVFSEIRNGYNAYLNTPSAYRAVLEYTSRIMELIKGKTKAYISNRKSIQLAEEIFAIGAYFESQGKKNSLVTAARMALEYTISRSAGAEMKMIIQCHNGCKDILVNHELDEAGRIRFDFACLGDHEAEKKIRFVINNLKDIALLLREDEATLMMGFVLDNVSGANREAGSLLEFVEKLKETKGYIQVKNKAESQLHTLFKDRKKALWDKLGHQEVSSPDEVEKVKETSRFLAEENYEQNKKLRDLLLRDDFEKLLESDELSIVISGDVLSI